MAKFNLIPYTASSAPNIVIETEFNQNTESLFISYRIREGAELIDLGNRTPNKSRKIKLWEKTCFELFIKNENNQYIEFNFSPTFEWNCFYFNKAGDPLEEWQQMPMPTIDILLSREHFFMFIDIKKEFFPNGFFNPISKLSAGITCVIKNHQEDMSYWALSHTDSRPNFHHFDSFKYKF